MDCPECGNDLEEDMRFCPNCGTRIPGEADTGSKQPASGRHPVTAPATSITISGLFSRKMLCLAIGILVLLVGAIAGTVADSGDAIEAGTVVYNLGGFVLGGTLLLGSFINEKLDRHLRVGMLIAGALVVGLTVTPAGVVGGPW